MPLPKVCVVVDTYVHPGQTFVNRHIDHLFGGNTCVLANKTREADGKRSPVFDRSAARPGMVRRIAGVPTMLRNRIVVGTGRVPIGAEKAAIADWMRREGVDVILSEFGTKAILVADLAQEMGLPCYTYLRGSDASSQLRKPRRRRAYRYAVPRLAGVVAVSRFLIDNLAAEGISHPNAHVIPSGVDTTRFQPGPKQTGTVLAVGRMVEKKAPDVTLRAFARVARRRPEARLRFIGEGPRLAATRALAAELGVADRVRFDGAQPHETVREALATSEIFVQHSVTASDGNAEGLPTAIQEAMATGCVVVSTRHAGIPEAVDHGVTGWLGAEHDVANFAALLDRALGEDKQGMAQRARRVACERFDNAVLLHRLEAVLNRTETSE